MRSSHSERLIRRHCQRWDRARGTKGKIPLPAAWGVLVASSFLVAACGSGPAQHGVASLGKAKPTTTQPGALAGPGPSGSSAPTEAQLLKYALCIRSHGVRDFPDPVPAAGGGFAFRVTPDANPRSPTPQFQSAETACQKDIPPGLRNLTPAESEAAALRYSVCMRSHGEPGFPEPDAQGLITITDRSGIMSPSAPQFQKAERACRNLDNGLFATRYSK